jgi:hypothetical protein
VNSQDQNKPAAATSRVIGFRSIGAVAFAAALVWSTFIAAGTWRDVRKAPEKHTIRITGSARKRIVSDLIQWEATIEGRGDDRTAAYRALREGTDKAVAFLSAQGIKPEEIKPQSAVVAEQFEKVVEDKVLPGTTVPIHTEKQVSKGFLARESIVVRSTDVARIEKASREITSLLDQGVVVNSDCPNYFYTHLGELKLEMLAQAAKDARDRAENILHSAGNTAVGKLIIADMGIININAANSTRTSEEGNNDTTSLEKDIITIVHAEFEVN